MKTITIDSDLGLDYRDVPPWRSYHLTAQGRTEAALLKNATISEVDQDGGDLACYSIEDASNEVAEAAKKLISDVLEKERKASL